MIQDRRLKRRFPIQAAMVVTSESRNQIIGTTRDVHSRGMYFYVDTPLPVGEHFQFTLSLAADSVPARQIEGTGRVLRVITHGAGTIGIAALIDCFRVAE